MTTIKCSFKHKDCEFRDDLDLCTWNKIERPFVVGVDLDGTILDFDGWNGHKHFGKVKRGAKKALERFKRKGYVIVIWTTRSNVKDIDDCLRKNNIPFDYINENPYSPPDSSDKIFCDVYVDDRGIEFKDNWDEVRDRVIDFIENDREWNVPSGDKND